MPQLPTQNDGPSIDVDVDAKYRVKLVELTEGPSGFPDAKPGEQSITWKFRLTHATTGEQVVDRNTNELYELWQWSPTTTYRNIKSGKASKAREWMEAFVGKELSDEQVTAIIEAGFAETLVNREALADIEWYVTKGGNTRLKIIRLRPVKKASAVKAEVMEMGATAGQAAATAREAVKRGEAENDAAGVTTRRAKAIADLGLDDDDDEEVAA